MTNVDNETRGGGRVALDGTRGDHHRRRPVETRARTVAPTMSAQRPQNLPLAVASTRRAETSAATRRRCRTGGGERLSQTSAESSCTRPARSRTKNRAGATNKIARRPGQKELRADEQRRSAVSSAVAVSRAHSNLSVQGERETRHVFVWSSKLALKA